MENGVIDCNSRSNFQITRNYKGKSLNELVDNYVVVDIETTGLSPKTDEIIEIGAVKVVNNVIIDTFDKFINIHKPLPNFISKLTGITNNMIENGEEIKEVLESFESFIEDNIIVGHNVNFDIDFIYDSYIRNLSKPFSSDYIDTLKIARKLINTLPSYKLSALADYFKIDYTDAHRASRDVEITFEVYNKLKECGNASKPTEILQENLNLDENFRNSKIAILTALKNLSFTKVEDILNKLDAKVYNELYPNTQYLLLNDIAYSKYMGYNTDCVYYESLLKRAALLENKGKLQVMSESEFCTRFSIPITMSKKV